MEINGQTITDIKRYDELGLSPEIMKALDSVLVGAKTNVLQG